MNDQPQASKLPETYDTALIGATISTVEPDRFTYSLRTLTQLVMHERQCHPPEARQIVFHEFIQSYGAEICFVDDTLVTPVEDTTPKIVIPKKTGNRRWS